METTETHTEVTQKSRFFFLRKKNGKSAKKRKVTRNEKISYAITIIISLINIAVSSYIVNKYVPEDEGKIIQCSKENGRYQKKLKQMPSVAQFSSYLRYIESRDTIKMWEFTGKNKQNIWGDKMNMLYQYILTHDYELKYIIPESETKFRAWIKFTDNVDDAEVSLLKNFHNTKIKDICETKIPEGLIDEVYHFIENRFLIEPDYTKDSVKNYIKDHMYNMTMHDIVIQDWRFPVNIASQLHLKPCDKLGYYSNMQSHEMIALVEMDKDTTDNQWKVKTFKTEAISRW